MLEIKKVNEDKRGKVYTIEGDDLKELKEVVILVTKKGYARGGCVHDTLEYVSVVEGEVEYQIGEGIYFMRQGSNGNIPAKAPHFYLSLTDSIVMEFGVDPTKKLNKDQKFREIVDEINENRVD